MLKESAWKHPERLDETQKSFDAFVIKLDQLTLRERLQACALQAEALETGSINRPWPWISLTRLLRRTIPIQSKDRLGTKLNIWRVGATWKAPEKKKENF